MIRHFIAPFIQTQKQKQLLMKVTLMMYLNQSTLLLYKAYKNLQDKVQVGLLTQSQIIIILIFESIIPQLIVVISNYQKNQSIQEEVLLIFKTLVIMNALNGAQSDTYIFQILIQQELQKLVKILQKDHFKDIKFLVKTRDIQKIEKKK